MQPLLIGMLALMLVLLAMRGVSGVSTGVLANVIRALGGIAALGAAVVLVSRGAFGYALPLGALGLWLLGQITSGGGGAWSQPASGGRTSTVATDHLEMELDLESGTMRGRVRKGVFAGRDIESLAPAELAILWQDCRFADPQSAHLIEAYLDRVHPSWREDMARAEAEPGPGGQMTVEEAYDILGLAPGASRDEIRRAHRDLMMKMHPDRGGSSYLATKINQAKDLLLSR